MDLELKRTKIKVKIYDDTFEVRKPTVKEYEAFAKNAVGLSESSAIDKMRELLKNCGISEKALDDLEMEHMTEVFQFLVGSKKK